MVIDTDSIYKTNETGAFLLECLAVNCTEEELFAKMCEKYGPETREDFDTLRKDMNSFLESTKSEGIVID